MPAKKTDSIQQIAKNLGVTESTIYRWIKAGKIIAVKKGRAWKVLVDESRKFLNHQLIRKYNIPRSAWTPKEINKYSEWHEILDEIGWLIKICYSSRKDIKHKRFKLDLLFMNYLTFHQVSLNKLRQIFPLKNSQNIQKIADDIKRGWYNEFSFSYPLRKSTLGLSFDDISINKSISGIRFAFPSWRITSSYYSIYFYIRAVTLQKVKELRIQEHNATILSFKNSVLMPLAKVVWKFPFDIQYSPKKHYKKLGLLIEKVKHVSYNYCNHPRQPHRSIEQIFDHVNKAYKKKAKRRNKLSSYMLFDYLHDFRIWANYLDIDNLLSLWGPGYKAFIDQNLSLLNFFIGGFSEICYISVFGEGYYINLLQEFYNSFIANNPELENDFANTPIYQRHIIYNNLQLITQKIVLKRQDDINVIVLSPNI